MDFRSDNTRGAAPQILAALVAANAEPSRSPYGEDAQTAALEERLAELFETELSACLVATGTAANALGLSLLTPPWGAIYCHEAAHVNVHECGAPEFYSGGAKLVPLAGEHGKLSAGQLASLLPDGRDDVHSAQPAAVSLTQATEAGTCYTPQEIAEICALAHRHGLRVHLDGARLANALAHLKCSPAQISWRAGVDVLSFGATKNGALAAEAVIVFDRALAATLAFRRKRAGHLFSKMRFLTGQFEAYLHDDLWLTLARRANALARRLGEGLAELPGARLCHPVEANEVFVELAGSVVKALRAEGFEFYTWAQGERQQLRLVTAFDTREAHVEALLAAAARAS